MDELAIADLIEDFETTARQLSVQRKTNIPEETQRKLFGLSQIAMTYRGPGWTGGSLGVAHIDADAMEPEQRAAVDEVRHLAPLDAMREYIALVDPTVLLESDEDEPADPAQLPPEVAARAAEAAREMRREAVEDPGSTDRSIFDEARLGNLAALAPLLTELSAAFTVNAADEDGLRALHHAVDAEQLGATRALLDAKADPNAKDGAGSTAIHYAALIGSVDICRALIEAGADVQAEDEDGKSPSDLARAEGHDALAAEIMAALSLKAKPSSSGAATSASEDATFKPVD